MTEQELRKANLIKGAINTLNAEIKMMENNIQNQEEGKRKKIPYFLFRIQKLIKYPTEKTHKGLWRTDELDGIGSIILLQADEIRLVVERKKEKVDTLKKELEAL